MESNLDKIAKDLYGKISVRFPDITIGDENAAVLSKKADIPRARFFEFEYTEKGQPLGTIAITLDEDDGIVIQISGDLSKVKTSHYKAYKFLRSFRKFAKARLLNFDIQNIGKSNLDKRDYHFQAKHKELPIMENKMFGTSRRSYQSLGEARLIIEHSQPINPDIAAGRSMHIKSIHIENAEGERFKYPYKHLPGARALAEHIKHGGTPYDSIGKHISGLSRELSELRKFKTYVGNKQQVSESMGGITNKVIERIAEVKKEVNNLQRGAYYEQFAESFKDSEEKIIPESVMNDWIDRLTVRTFNEEMKTVFPYLYNILDESELPIVELSADDILDETSSKLSARGELEKAVKKAGVSSDYWEKANAEQAARHANAEEEEKQRAEAWRKKFGKSSETLDEVRTSKQNWFPTLNAALESEDLIDQWPFGRNISYGETASVHTEDETGHPRLISIYRNEDGMYERPVHYDLKTRPKKRKSLNPEAELESFLEGIVNEDKNELYSDFPLAQNRAIKKLDQLLASEMVGGVPGIDALRGIIDDPEFTKKIAVLDSDEEIRNEIKQDILNKEPSILPSLNNMYIENPSEIGGVDTTQSTPEPGPTTQPMAEPTGEEPMAGGEPTGEEPTGEEPTPPMSESVGKKTKMKARFIKAKNAGATLDTKFAEGMTILDAIMECGLDPEECGYRDSSESGIDQLLKIISGFWNGEKRNFTIGNQGAKNKIEKAIDNGECPNASDDDIEKVYRLIDKKDPGSNEDDAQQAAILKLAGLGGRPEITIIKTDSRSDNLLDNIKTMASPMMEGALDQIKRNAGLL